MNIIPTDPPRKFEVGKGTPITITDCARIELSPDELITFVSEFGAEYDVVQKNWGFYATPSINDRLTQFGMKTALILGNDGKLFVFLVEKGKEKELESYLNAESLEVLCWLDNPETIENFKKCSAESVTGDNEDGKAI